MKSKSKKPIVIFGAGEFADLVFYYFSKFSKRKVIAFCVDDKFLEEIKQKERPVVPLGKLKEKYPPSQFDAFVAIGYSQVNGLRQNKIKELRRLGYTLSSFISPKACVLTDQIGENCFIFESVNIQPFVKIGDGVIVWTGSTIAHHSDIGECSFIGPAASISGNVKLGQRCFVGINATIRDHVEVGERSIIGAGALVVENITPKSLVKSAKGSSLTIGDEKNQKI